MKVFLVSIRLNPSLRSGPRPDRAFGLNNLTAGKEMQMVKIERNKK